MTILSRAHPQPDADSDLIELSTAIDHADNQLARMRTIMDLV